MRPGYWRWAAFRTATDSPSSPTDAGPARSPPIPPRPRARSGALVDARRQAAHLQLLLVGQLGEQAGALHARLAHADDAAAAHVEPRVAHRREREKSRDPFFDNAKFLLVTLVVIGHSWNEIYARLRADLDSGASQLVAGRLPDGAFAWRLLKRSPGFAVVPGLPPAAVHTSVAGGAAVATRS